MLSNKLDTLKNAREWKCKITTNKGIVYTETDISSFKLSTKQDTSKLIGQTVARELEIEAMTTSANDFSGILKVEIGLKCWNAQEEKWYYEWRTLGSTFKADTIEQVNKFTTKVTCYDAMTYKFNDKYIEGTALTETTTVALQEHIASKFGITFNKTVPNFQIANPYQETYRDIIGYLAILLGSNCFYANDSDTIKFAPLVRDTVDLEVGEEFYFEYKEDRAEAVIKKLNLDLGGGFGYYAGYSDAEENEQVIIECPFANQEITDHVFSLIQGYEPCGYELKFMGNPCIEPYDKIKLTTVDKVVHILDVASSEFNFNGGFSQTLRAEKVTEESSGGSYVENKLTSKINVLADRIQMQVSDLTDELNQTQTSITQTKNEILTQVSGEYVKKTENKAYSVILSNEFQNIPTNSEGYPLEDGSFECKVRLFNGSTELTDFQLSISATNSYGITVSVNNDTKVVLFTYKKSTKITKNGDEITVYIRVGDSITLEKKISWTKTSNGVDGTSFNIKGTLDSVNSLPNNATQGDAFIINGDLYVFTENGIWENCGRIQGENGASISCNIVPNSLVFKSGDGGQTYNPSTIVLTAICSNCNLLRWEYHHNNEWKSVTTYAPDLLNGDTISINYDNSLLNTLNNQITFKAITDAEGVIDIVTITKLSVLDNEVETIREISKSAIDQKANEIMTTVETTYQKKTEMGDYVTTESMNSAIDQKANEINLSVSTKVNEEFSKVELGFRNLISESMPKETGSSSIAFAKRNIIELNNETTYTLSCNGHVNSTTSEAYLKVRIFREDEIAEQWYTKISADKDTTVKLTFTTTDKSEGHQYYIESILMPSGANGTATINWYKLERGNIASDWTPAPEDANAQIEALEDMTGDLQNQIDGKIETYYQSADPSISWDTVEIKTHHKGDIWYDTSNGVTYRWSGNDWTKLTDSDAEQAKSLASSKAQVFTSQPKPPYAVGDLWVQGSSGDIMRCVYARSSGNYVSSDWSKASKYTDDTTANQVASDLANNYYTITETDNAIKVAKGSIELSVSEKVESVNQNINVVKNDLQGQIDGKIQTYYQTTDPSIDWTTTELKTQHKGDIWYNNSENVTYRWSGSTWSKLSDIDALQAQALANKKAQVFTSQPTIPYYKNDLWVQGSSGDIMKCTTTRTSGSYSSSDWTKASKYTDDTAANNVMNNLETNYYTKSQTDNAITVAKGSIELSVNKQVETIIDNIEIGGRNLIRNSAFVNGIHCWSFAPNVSLDASRTFNGHPTVKSSQSGLTHDEWRGCTNAYLPITNPITANQTYTLSCYYYVEDTSVFDSNIGLEVKGVKSSSTSGTQSHICSIGVSQADLVSNKWTRIVGTFTLTEEYSSSFVYAWVGKNGTAWFTEFKLEKGDKCTDWSAAPEDAQDSTDAINNNLASNYYTKSETEGKIEVTSNNITTSVSETYATKSSLNSLQQRVNSAEQQITSESIINKVNTSLNNGKSISTTSTTLNKNGFTVYNGAIYIKNKNNENVLWGDTNGNVQAKGKITTIDNNGYLNLEGNKLQGYKSGMSVPMYSCGMWYPNNGSTLSGFVSVSNGNSLLGDSEGCLYMSGWNDSSNANKKAVLQYSRNQGGQVGAVEFYNNGGVSITSRSKDVSGGYYYGIWNSQEGYVYPYRGDEYFGGSTRPWTRAYIKEMYQGSVSYFSAQPSNYLLANVNNDEIKTYSVNNKPTPKDFVEFVENLEFGIYKNGEDNEEVQTFAEKETNLNFMPIVDNVSTFALDENPAKSLVIQTVTDRDGENPEQAINLMSYCSALAITIQELIKENKLLKERLDKIEKEGK